MLKKLNRTTSQTPQTFPVKVLQFGKGNFLRAFAGWMVDVMNEKGSFNGAIQIVQVSDPSTDRRFEEQEGLYHVVLNGLRAGQPVRETRLVTCVTGVINPLDDYFSYLKTAENPALEFVISNTTEAGIEFRANEKSPEVVPDSFPGKLTALLFRRYQFFGGDPQKALTILPCELIERNGEMLRDHVLKYAAHWKLDEGFETWIRRHTLFCNTLVDRIVPGFPKENVESIWKETGFEDNLVVTAEPFHQWVIEPKLGTDRTLEKLMASFPLQRCGLQVKFTDDLSPYRTSKVRILNGAHTAMVPVGYLRGLRTVKEVIDNGFTGDFVRRCIDEEIIPTLDLPQNELKQFAKDTIERFQNPFIRHELKSIALNSVSKFQVRVLPTILSYIQRTGKLPQRLVYAFAALILFYKGEWRGERISLNDTGQVLAFFQKAWERKDRREVIAQVLSNRELWKTDLTAVDGLSSAIEKEMAAISDVEITGHQAQGLTSDK